MRLVRRRGSRLATLVLGIGLAGAAGVGGGLADDAAVSLPSGSLPTEAAGIQKLLEAYVKAVEAKDVQAFRAVKPNLSEDEERRVRAAFKSIQTQVVKINVLSLDVKEGKATVKVARRDTINGSIVSSFPQTFLLAKLAAGWTIQDIGR
jgi:hypothetical protein